MDEARELATRFDNAGLSAWSRVQLGLVALAGGRQEEARMLLDEALDLSLATHSTRREAVAAVRDRRDAGTRAP